MTQLKYRLGELLNNIRQPREIKLDLPQSERFAEVDGLLVGKLNGQWQAYDSICDHNGGKLALNDDKTRAVCPLHKWTLLLNDGKYENGCAKHSLAVTELEDSLIVSRYDESFSPLDNGYLTASPLEFIFNAHASVSIIVNDLQLITDPWLLGPCFATGWWHAYPPSQQAVERLKSSNLIYISHNHPDHLHLPSLKQCVNANTQFIVPNFESKSVETILRREGYNNLIIADFLQEIIIDTDQGQVKLVVVNSGDDRDDSSLLIYTQNSSAFLGVDTNMPNRWILPKVDVLFTPFSGGATAFPSRIENFSRDEKIQIINTNRKFMLTNHVTKIINATQPKYVVPYAGYFTELYRDNDVKNINIKNSAAEMIAFVEARFKSLQGINPLITPKFRLVAGQVDIIEVQEIPAYRIDQAYVEQHIQAYVGDTATVDSHFLDQLGQQFIRSEFIDDLTLLIIPSDDDFLRVGSQLLAVDFSAAQRQYQLISLEDLADPLICQRIAQQTANNIELLRIRQDTLKAVVSHGLPFEDLSIGFQTKMYRQPNVYNFKFWNHFTNIEFVRCAG